MPRYYSLMRLIPSGQADFTDRRSNACERQDDYCETTTTMLS